jgi:hypothetical protein
LAGFGAGAVRSEPHPRLRASGNRRWPHERRREPGKTNERSRRHDAKVKESVANGQNTPALPSTNTTTTPAEETQVEPPVEAGDLCDLINAKLAEMFVVGDDDIVRLRDGLSLGHTPTSADIKEARGLAHHLGLSLEEREDGDFVLTEPEDEDWSRRFRDLTAVYVYLIVIRDTPDSAEKRKAQDAALDEKTPKATDDEVGGVEEMKAKLAALDDEVVIGGVEDTAVVRANVLDTIAEARGVAEAYRKVFKVSRFDHGAKKEIGDAIESLIRKWRAVQSALAEPPPSGPGGEPEPAQAETVSEQVDHLLPQQQVVQAGENVPPVSPTPPSPAPALPLTPTPPPLSPAPALRTKVLPHYVPAHRDPWPKDWRRRRLSTAELKDLIRAVQEHGVNHRLEDRHHQELAKMRERLALSEKADRAERPRTGMEARL